MDSTTAVSTAFAPIYAAVAVYGLVTSSLVRLMSGIKSGTSAATMPALAAAGLIWQAKELLSNDQGNSSLQAQPSILNWHDQPVPQE